MALLSRVLCHVGEKDLSDSRRGLVWGELGEGGWKRAGIKKVGNMGDKDPGTLTLCPGTPGNPVIPGDPFRLGKPHSPMEPGGPGIPLSLPMMLSKPGAPGKPGGPGRPASPLSPGRVADGLGKDARQES